MRWVAAPLALIALVLAACDGVEMPSTPEASPSSGQRTLDGVVIAVGSGRLVLHPEYAAEGPALELEVTAATRIWKGDDVPLSDVAVGDRAFVTVKERPDGTLEALTVDLNLVRAAGRTVYRDGDTFVVRGTPGISPHTDVAVVKIGASTLFEGGGRDDLQLGRGVDVIGVRREDGTIVATQIWIAPPEP